MKGQDSDECSTFMATLTKRSKPKWGHFRHRDFLFSPSIWMADLWWLCCFNQNNESRRWVKIARATWRSYVDGQADRQNDPLYGSSFHVTKELHGLIIITPCLPCVLLMPTSFTRLGLEVTSLPMSSLGNSLLRLINQPVARGNNNNAG